MYWDQGIFDYGDGVVSGRRQGALDHISPKLSTFSDDYDKHEAH